MSHFSCCSLDLIISIMKYVLLKLFRCYLFQMPTFLKEGRKYKDNKRVSSSLEEFNIRERKRNKKITTQTKVQMILRDIDRIKVTRYIEENTSS